MLVLVVPTMIWIRLRVQWISRILEFLCLLPLTIPAIVLVVGLAPIYNRIRALQLSRAAAVLGLRRSWRCRTPTVRWPPAWTRSTSRRCPRPRAASGRSWVTVMFRVIAPNMWQAILNALLLTVALVLGEFTIAYLLLYVNLQVTLFESAGARRMRACSSRPLPPRCCSPSSCC